MELSQVSVNPRQKPTIIAVGYSVRALVEACVQSEYSAIAVDHFGDADTLRFTDRRWIPLELTDEKCLSLATRATLVALAEQLDEPAIVLLAGGMENLPLVVAELASIFRVFGPSVSQIQQLRDWQFWKRAAEATSIRFSDSYASYPNSGNDRQSPTDGDWLWKANDSAGGLGVSEHVSREASAGYYQKFVAGCQLGVTCIAHDEAVEFVGATRGFDFAEWPGPTRFIYRGNCGPVSLAQAHTQQIVELANFFRTQLNVRGWLQFDFIQDITGQLWLLECNPRWTAGMEILTHAGLPLIEQHLLACSGQPWSGIESRQIDTKCFAKAIVYAPQAIEVTQSMIDDLAAAELLDVEAGRGVSWLADIPSQPQAILAGHPIATVRCSMPTQHETPDDSMTFALTRLHALQTRLLRDVLKLDGILGSDGLSQ